MLHGWMRRALPPGDGGVPGC